MMIREWRLSGKNVDGELMIVKGFNSRQMEAYVFENVVACVFISRQDQVEAPIRDQAHIARVYAALSQEGLEELNTLIVHETKRHGFADANVLSSDTTMQELPIGYPNELGILRGIAQRRLRTWRNWASRGCRASMVRWSKPSKCCAR